MRGAAAARVSAVVRPANCVVLVPGAQARVVFSSLSRAVVYDPSGAASSRARPHSQCDGTITSRLGETFTVCLTGLYVDFLTSQLVGAFVLARLTLGKTEK